jgi:Amidase
MEELTVDKAHQAFRSGNFTALDLVIHYLERIDKIDKSGPNLNGVLAVNLTAASEASALDKHLKETGDFKGPLHGIPVIVKDQAATAGLTTTYGSVKAQDNVPTKDATLVKKLKDAGAVVLAKSTMPGTYISKSLTLNQSLRAMDSNNGLQTGRHLGSRPPPSPARHATPTTSPATSAAPPQAQALRLPLTSPFSAWARIPAAPSDSQRVSADWSD